MLITVIVPVYNVEAYIDTCLESIAHQTYADFEALLVDDGSTDGSGELCDRWAERDRRFRAIHQANGGVSAARNRGIDEAKGEYLAFVDPDDWLDLRYLEKLLRAARQADADLAECDIWRVNGRTGQKIHRSCWGAAGVPWTLAEHMKYGSTATYKSISRRALWIEHGVRLPDCAFESPAVYALILALANKVVNVREPLYYYRRFRPDSLIETGYAGKDGAPNNTLGTEAMAHLLSEFRRVGLYGQYRDVLEGVVKYRLSDILATQFHRKKEEDYRETVRSFRTFLQKAFPDSCNARYMTFGGYNLGRILVHLDLLHDPACRFNFSSLIALADPEEESRPGGEISPGVCADPESPRNEERIRIRHFNRYREIMLQREEDQTIWQLLAAEQPEYFFIDLLEERFPVRKRGRRYITLSDAREGAEENTRTSDIYRKRDPADAEAKPVSAGQPEERRDESPAVGCGCPGRTELFRRACRAFFGKLQAAVPGIRVVVVEDYLCGSLGCMRELPAGAKAGGSGCGLQADLRTFDDAGEIREKNRALCTYYRILREVCPDAVRIVPGDAPELEGLLFTDIGYEYGAVPSHLNEYANRKIAGLIAKKLFAEKGAGS